MPTRMTHCTPKSYSQALAILDAGETLKSRDTRKIAPNTWLERQGEWPNNPDSIRVRLHNTYVVTFHYSGAVSLDSGGWRTVTTKERINNYLPDGVRLSQERFVWYVQDMRKEFQPVGAAHDSYNPWHKRYRVEFVDGLTILPDASLHGLELERKTSTADA